MGARKKYFHAEDRVAVHEFFDQRMPVTGWVGFGALARQFRAETKTELNNQDIADILTEAGWVVNVTPRGPYNGVDGRVSRDGGEYKVRRPKRDQKHRWQDHKYPYAPATLREFLDRNVAPGTEVEAPGLYARFCKEYQLGPVPSQIFTRQLDTTEYRVLSTTRNHRRCRMLQRRHPEKGFIDLRSLYGKPAA